MRILWVKAGKILPVDTGGKIRSYNILRHLALRHETTFLSYYAGNRDERYEREISDLLPGAVALHTGGGPTGAIGLGLDYLWHLPSPVPYAVTKFTAPAVRHRVGSWLSEPRFDVAVCDFLSASQNFPDAAATPMILFQHNVESALWRRQAAHEPNPIKRAAFAIEARKMRRYERSALDRFHHVIAVSEHDRDLMAEMADASRISVVPTGVDVAHYRTVRGSSGAGTDAQVLFLGSMDWEANVDGVEHFCREIWPRVTAAVPGARFRVVGRNPHPRIQRLASPSVEITGGVPSVLPHLAAATAFVVPLRIGGGTRLKIFEAMAAGRPVISTGVGAEGLDVRHGENILLADAPGEFADAVVRVLRDRELRSKLESGGASLAARYDWSHIAGQFADILAAASRSPVRAERQPVPAIPASSGPA
ncbi:MAG: glycosyltransferase family 4 protein [Gemmatimonadaceae bacterium]